MKKRLLATALIATMVLSMTACGGEKEEKQSSVSVNESQTQQAGELTTESGENEAVAEDSRLDKTFTSGRPDYTIDYDWNFMRDEQVDGYSSSFRGMQFDFAIVFRPYYNKYGNEDNTDLSAIKTSADVVNVMLDANVAKTMHQDWEVESFMLDTTETLTIDGVECTRNTGTVRFCDNFYKKFQAEYKFVSYGLIAETGRPYLFVGIDRTEDNSYIAELEELLDLMMPTFKDGGATDGFIAE